MTDATRLTSAPPVVDQVNAHTFRATKAATFEAAHFMGHVAQGHPYKNLHGHSFRVEVTVIGQAQAGEGWVQDFDQITAALDQATAELDHSLLNEVPGLETPTLEMLCVWFSRRLKPALPGLTAVEVSRPSLGERVLLELR